MRRNQTRHSTDRRGLERWNQHARREQLYIGVKVLPSLPPSLHHSSFLVSFCVCVCVVGFTYLFLFLFFFISNSLLRRSVSPKVQRSQTGSRRNKETLLLQKILAYPQRNTNQIDTKWSQPLLSSISILLSSFSCRSFSSFHTLPMCHRGFFISLCRSLFLSTLHSHRLDGVATWLHFTWGSSSGEMSERLLREDETKNQRCGR